MANKDLRRSPHNIRADNANFWWYEEPQGIEVHHAVHNNNGHYLRHIKFLIKWKALRKALARKDK